MTSRITKLLIFSTLGLTVTIARPASALPPNYGTGLHHWVKTCDLGNTKGTSEYVRAVDCPPYVTLPINCRCDYTPYDFPVDNPYPYRVVASVDPEDPGHIRILLDTEQVIQCGVTVIPADDQEGSCGDPFLSVLTEPSDIDPGILETLQSFAPDFEKETGSPVTSFTFWLAQQPE